MEWLKMAISEMTGHHLERLEDIAKTGENKDSLAAIKLLWSYAYGNPAQVLTGADGTPLFTGLVPDLLKSMHKLSDK